MRIEQHFCDVHAGKETFHAHRLVHTHRLVHAHRLVLAANSPYFAALFTGGMKESSEDVVQIFGVEAGTFQLLLDFNGTGLVGIAVNNDQELIAAADMLQWTEVVHLCCDFSERTN